MCAGGKAYDRGPFPLRRRRPEVSGRGFTLIELLMVIAIISILASMLLPTLSRAKEQARRIKCLSNQHQISLGLRLWADDNDSRYPWEVDAYAGGSRGSRATWQHLVVLEREIVTPKVLICPSDNREPALDFSTNRNTGLKWHGNYGVSYFVGLDANEGRPQMHLLGDRNIDGLEKQDCEVAGVTGVVTWLNVTNDPTWSSAVHRWAGNVTRVDGSIALLGRNGLKSQCVAAAANTHANCVLKPEFGFG
jgi:prepilin-type N-terminal cleavage/methylation domain-containing protein